MNILEMINKDPCRTCSPPGSIFEAMDRNGKKRLLCFADIENGWALANALQKHPDLLQWEVTREHFTEQDITRWKVAQAFEPKKTV